MMPERYGEFGETRDEVKERYMRFVRCFTRDRAVGSIEEIYANLSYLNDTDGMHLFDAEELREMAEVAYFDGLMEVR